MVVGMSNDTQRRWTRQDGEDASRLLAELAKRGNKASGGLKRPEQIQQSGEVPRVAGEEPPERANREAAQRPGAVTVSRLGGIKRGSADGLVLAANDNERHAAALASR